MVSYKSALLRRFFKYMELDKCRMKKLIFDAELYHEFRDVRTVGTSGVCPWSDVYLNKI